MPEKLYVHVPVGVRTPGVEIIAMRERTLETLERRVGGGTGNRRNGVQNDGAATSSETAFRLRLQFYATL